MPASISISIALCTCNGGRFLEEQLASLASQHHLPTELVVCDDASDDNTYELLERFASNAPFAVRLHRNTQRLGIGPNFEQAIRLCTESVIALCDQDDVWMPEKLSRYAEQFAQCADWVCCNARLTDAALSLCSNTLWEVVRFSADERERAASGHFFEVLAKHSVVAGATLAFRSEIRDKLLPIPQTWLYDAWLAAVLGAAKRVAVIDECLQLYRQHENNAIGGRRRNFISNVRNALTVNRSDYLNLEILKWAQLSEHLKSLQVPDPIFLGLKDKRDHLERRAELPNSRLLRIHLILDEVGRGGYARFSRNWESIALDLFLK